MTEKPMVVLYDDGPFSTLRCECGTEFNVDAIFDENVELVVDDRGRHLVAKCPNCGATPKALS